MYKRFKQKMIEFTNLAKRIAKVLFTKQSSEYISEYDKSSHEFDEYKNG